MQITLLIRCSYRPRGFARTWASIPAWATVICSYDDERALDYIPQHVRKLRVYKHQAAFFYDNYVNDLKAFVETGYFGVLDEGDTLVPGALSRLAKLLEGTEGVICQFSRNGRIKPKTHLIQNRQIIQGKIGMPCLFLHAKHRHLVDLDGSLGAADYTWIKMVARKVRLKFIPLVVVECGERDKGVMEEQI